MPSNPTRGSIETIEGESIRINFPFNPKEYTVTKQIKLQTPNASRGQDSAPLEFAGGEPQQIKLSLFFDTYEEGKDVRKEYTDKLFKMTEINTGLPQGTSDRNGSPPKCLFQWGTNVMSFVCFIESLSVQYTLFLTNGTPVRATATVGLKQATDPRQQAGTNPTSGGEGGERAVVVKPSERLDLIAYRAYGDASQWRVIANANNITDPLSLRPGQRLMLPPTVT